MLMTLEKKLSFYILLNILIKKKIENEFRSPRK